MPLASRDEDLALDDEGETLFEMANLRPEATNIPGLVVFVSQKGGARHDVRVKVARGPTVHPSDFISIAVRPAVRYAERRDDGKLSAVEFDAVSRWIALNEQTLVGYWDGAIPYTDDMLKAIKPLP